MADLSDLEVVVYEQVGPVAVLRMNRPDRLNTFNWQMHRDMIRCYDHINASDDIKVVVVTGTGRYFSAGRDIKEFLETYDSGNENALRPLDDPDHPLFRLYATSYPMKKPLIAAVNGHVLGGGLSFIVSMVDMIVMSEDATIKDAHAKVNIGSLSLIHLLPANIAREVAYSDRALTSEECLRWGIANYVVPADQVLPKAIALATHIATMGPDSLRMGKERARQVLGIEDPDYSPETMARLREEARARREAEKNNSDLLEGMRAFAQKRSAEYVKPV
jgi:enoyl-CoA hydratase/carnithine racemase